MSGSLVICSGGIDSTVCLYNEIEERGKEMVKVVTFAYGQKAIREHQCLTEILAELDIVPSFLDMRRLMSVVSDSALTNIGENVPVEGSRQSTMERTVVPGRNGMFIWAACMLASKLDCDTVVYGAHKNDEAMYIDCRPSFVAGMQSAIKAGFDKSLVLRAPMLFKTKAEVIEWGSKLRVPLSKTWSCYKGEELQCGECSSCVERREAFKEANVVDDTRYAK